MHRISHHIPWLWYLHEPHRSAERLYWLNGERRYPFYAAIMAGPGLLILFAMGIPSELLATGSGYLQCTWLSSIPIWTIARMVAANYRRG